jgi:ankyrin repeat protein
MNNKDNELWKNVHDANIPGIKKAILAGADVNVTGDGVKLTPLHVGALFGDEKVCLELIAAGAKVNAVSTEGKTAYHYSELNGNSAYSDALVKAGADESIIDENGETPIDIKNKIINKKVRKVSM